MTTRTVILGDDMPYTFPVVPMTFCAPLRTVTVLDMRGHPNRNDPLRALVQVDVEYMAVAFDSDNYRHGDIAICPNGWMHRQRYTAAPHYSIAASFEQGNVTIPLEPGQMLTSIFLPNVMRSVLYRSVSVQDGLKYEGGCIYYTDEEDTISSCECKWCMSVCEWPTIPIYVPEIETTLEVIDGRECAVPICGDGFLRLVQNEGVLGAYIGFMESGSGHGVMLSSAPETAIENSSPTLAFSTTDDWFDECWPIKRMEPHTKQCPTGVEVHTDPGTARRLREVVGWRPWPDTARPERPLLEM